MEVETVKVCVEYCTADDSPKDYPPRRGKLWRNTINLKSDWLAFSKKVQRSDNHAVHCMIDEAPTNSNNNSQSDL